MDPRVRPGEADPSWAAKIRELARAGLSPKQGCRLGCGETRPGAFRPNEVMAFQQLAAAARGGSPVESAKASAPASITTGIRRGPEAQKQMLHVGMRGRGSARQRYWRENGAWPGQDSLAIPITLAQPGARAVHSFGSSIRPRHGE
jgi:hypothetical protein